MALTARETIRAEISALFDSISELQSNVAYPPLELKGQSPVLSLHTGGTSPTFTSASANEIYHQFVVTVYVNREAHGAENSETLLDQIVLKVLQKIRDDVSGTSYMTLEVKGRSGAQFAEIDGIQYRLEEITLEARTNGGG